MRRQRAERFWGVRDDRTRPNVGSATMRIILLISAILRNALVECPRFLGIQFLPCAFKRRLCARVGIRFLGCILGLFLLVRPPRFNDSALLRHLFRHVENGVHHVHESVSSRVPRPMRSGANTSSSRRQRQHFGRCGQSCARVRALIPSLS